MAELDDLLAQVDDEGVRSQLKAAVDTLRRQLRFGLVFERHLPESIRAYNAPIAVLDTVQIRAELVGGDEYVVERLTRQRADIASTTTGEQRSLHPKEIVVVKRFGEPAYPALRSLGGLHRSETRPAHAVINGENFHALQLLRYLYGGKVDCIYIDPPYNTGASDWKYNNRYVESQDRWRHSKWLSFMEKRLHLAKELLKPDGVLIVTIDEHEIHHLGVLLEQIFTGYLQHTITIVMNPKGTGKLNFSRVGEYAIFCIPDNGENVVNGLPVVEADVLTGLRTQEHEDVIDEDAVVNDDDLEVDEDAGVDVAEAIAVEESANDLPFPREELDAWELRHARRRGGESSYRHQRKNQFYPLFVDSVAKKVVGVGSSLALDEDPDMTIRDGIVPVWPIDKEGNHRCWRYVPETMQTLIDDKRLVLGQESADGTSWTINYWVRKTERKKYKTVWWAKPHDAGTHGTSLLHKFIEQRNAFPFPKSLYAVRDTLLAVVRDRPDALILDFFAGSGTTLHATALINESDGGRRRCVLVTNNEVDGKTAARLKKEGHLPGDREFEAHGIFWQATRPRCEAAISGQTPSGKPVPGKYITGRAHSAGFEENVEFFELRYLNKDDVSQGSQFPAIEPSLWLAAGGVGERAESDETQPFALAPRSNYAVLFERSAFAAFKRAVTERSDITHVFLVTDSETAYKQMSARLPEGITTSMLYRDYLSNFRINTPEAYR